MPETDAQPTDVTDELPVIPGYELLRVIGAGGMSRVILARSSQGELVAIKLIVEGDTQRLAQEVAIWQEVSHSRIVRLLDHGRCDAGIYLVLDYIDGGTLRERMG